MHFQLLIRSAQLLILKSNRHSDMKYCFINFKLEFYRKQNLMVLKIPMYLLQKPVLRRLVAQRLNLTLAQSLLLRWFMLRRRRYQRLAQNFNQKYSQMENLHFWDHHHQSKMERYYLLKWTFDVQKAWNFAY